MTCAGLRALAQATTDRYMCEPACTGMCSHTAVYSRAHVTLSCKGGLTLAYLIPNPTYTHLITFTHPFTRGGLVPTSRRLGGLDRARREDGRETGPMNSSETSGKESEFSSTIGCNTRVTDTRSCEIVILRIHSHLTHQPIRSRRAPRDTLSKP